MGRLTKINEDACDLCKSWVLCKDKNCLSYEVYKKLAHYEDLEEQLMESAEIDIDSMVGEFMHYYNLQKENRLIEQKHGTWIPNKHMIRTPTAENYHCSECTQAGKRTSYCPHCGAKMELKELEGDKE